MTTTQSTILRALIAGMATAISLGVLWGLLEGAAALGLADFRLLFPQKTGQPWDSPHNRLDAELFYLHRPHHRIRGTVVGGDLGQVFQVPSAKKYSFDVRTDRDGFRNESDIEQAPVVVIGDSYIEGVLVADEELITSQLARRMQRPVVNLGMIGYGPEQELIVFKRYGLPRKPQACVWCFFEGNDLTDIALYQVRKAVWPQQMRLLGSASTRSFTMNLLAFLDRLAEPSSPLLPFDANTLGRTPTGENMYFLHQSDGLTNREKESLSRLKEILAEWHGLCAERGILPVFAFIPTKIRVYAEICTFSNGVDAPSWYIADLPEQMRTLAHGVSADIIFVDLTEPLRRAARRGDDTYFTDDSHWTATGHRVVADALAEAIEHRGSRSP